MEIWLLRRVSECSEYRGHKRKLTNAANSTRKLMRKIKRRQAECVGHVMRKRNAEQLDATGKWKRTEVHSRERTEIQEAVDMRDCKQWKLVISYHVTIQK